MPSGRNVRADRLVLALVSVLRTLIHELHKERAIEIGSLLAALDASIAAHRERGGPTAPNCDFRIAARKPARFGLNEVTIGIPMPAAYVEIIGVLRRIEERTAALDELVPAGMSDEGNRRAQDRRRQEIMHKR